jgi:hypothetical protein
VLSRAFRDSKQGTGQRDRESFIITLHIHLRRRRCITMMMRRQVCRSLIVGLAVIVGLGLGVLAQSISLTVTAYSDAVRFSAQGSVKELRVEVLSLSGQKVFDSGPVLGNALDWKLLNSQGQPVANGSISTRSL